MNSHIVFLLQHKMLQFLLVPLLLYQHDGMYTVKHIKAMPQSSYIFKGYLHSKFSTGLFPPQYLKNTGCACVAPGEGTVRSWDYKTATNIDRTGDVRG